MCLFFFYVLIINATRSHGDLQKGFSALPGKYFLENLKNVANDGSFPMFRGILNSVIVSSCSAALCTYFSSLTAYGLYAYEFKARKVAFTFIMAILVMQRRLLQWDSFVWLRRWDYMIPFCRLIIPSIASPAVFYFMYSYLQSSLPLSLVEAARIDGSGEFHTFNSHCDSNYEACNCSSGDFYICWFLEQLLCTGLIIQSKSKMTVPILIATLRGAELYEF